MVMAWFLGILGVKVHELKRALIVDAPNLQKHTVVTRKIQGACCF